MKRAALLSVLMLSLTVPASAQNFSLGGRYSNYSTDLDPFETGRQSSVGFLAGYRNGPLGLSFQYDHDLENGISLIDLLPIDFAEYSRDRGEFALSYSVLPNLDIEGGVRLEEISLGGASFFGQEFFSDLSVSHQALLAGVNFHSQTIRPVGWYASVRGYIGSAEFEDFGAGVSEDTTGYRVELGVPIALGLSGWEVAPGVEYERIESENLGFDLETNRFFVNFVYTFNR